MNRLRRVASVALVAPLLFGLASCTEEEPVPKMPDPPVEPTTAETTTQTPEPKEPWEEKSYAGAEAFTKHWFDVFSEAVNSGDVTDLRAISNPDCVNCNGFIDRIEKVYGAGGYYESRGWHVVQVTALKSAPIATPVLGMRMKVLPGRYKESAGGRWRSDTGFESAYSADLDWVSGMWRMAKFEPVA